MTDPRLVVVCGPPGVGKSRVARAAADRLDGTVLRTDLVRQDLFETPRYDDAATRRVYAELHARARDRLAEGEAVVLDGTYRATDLREAAAEAAAAAGADLHLLRVTCPTDTVRERIRARTDDPSEAEFEDHRTIAADFDPVERPHTVVDNGGDFERTRRQLAAALPE